MNTRIQKSFILIVALFVLPVSQAFAQRNDERPQRLRIFQELDLTVEQQEKLTELRKEHQKEMMDLRSDHFKNMQKELTGILNDDQLERFNELRSERYKQFEENLNERMDYLSSRLDLNDSQKSQIKEILTSKRQMFPRMGRMMGNRAKGQCINRMGFGRKGMQGKGMRRNNVDRPRFNRSGFSGNCQFLGLGVFRDELVKVLNDDQKFKFYEILTDRMGRRNFRRGF